MSPLPRLGWFLLGFATAMACVAAALGLAWTGVIVLPQYISPSKDAREAALLSDLQTVRSQLELYKVQHLDRCPHLDANGQPDTANFVARLTGRTDQEGRLTADGGFGPYLMRFPANPFVKSSGRAITFGTGPPPGDKRTGWYLDAATGAFHANDPDHKDL